MIIRKIAITLLCIISLSCNSSRKNIESKFIIAKCERIIIQDSVHDHFIHFLISYENKSDKQIVIFANPLDKKTKEKTFKNGGFYLKSESVNTPIGQFHSSNFFIVEPNSTLKIPYTYSEKFPNQIVSFDSKSIKEKLKKSSLYYHYDKNLMDSLFVNNEAKIGNATTVDGDFQIDLNNVEFEYNENLTIEDLVKMANGKLSK